MAATLPIPTLPSSQPTPAGRSPLARWRWYAILGGGLGIAVLVVLWPWQRSPISPPTENQTNQNASEAAVDTNRQTFERFPSVVQADRDADGLTDDQERQQGTNPNLADSDGDELSDAEEVRVYQTNPLRQDTDGDGFPDGQEVQTGNNPNGPGRLRDVSNAIRSLTNSTNTNIH